MRIDEFPTNELDGIQYRCGHVLPFGASVIGNGVIHFSVFSKDATGCTLLLFHAGEKEPFIRIPFPEEFRIGNVYSMIVYGLDFENLEYGYSMDGPYDPASGYRFDREKVLLDPYARLVSGREVWGAEPAADFGTEEDAFIYCAVNAYWEETTFALSQNLLSCPKKYVVLWSNTENDFTYEN